MGMTARKMVRLDNDDLKWLEQEAKRRDRTLSYVIRDAVKFARRMQAIREANAIAYTGPPVD